MKRLEHALDDGILHVQCEGVTRPLPVFTHATVYAGLVHVSCVQGFIPGTFDFPSPEAGAQARQVLENLRTILEQAGSDLKHVLKATIFLRDMSDFPEVNAAFNEAFPEKPPARSTLAVLEIPQGARVVIEAVAAVRPARLPIEPLRARRTRLSRIAERRAMVAAAAHGGAGPDREGAAE